MPSSWILARPAKAGRRYRVLYRLGGRESSQRYAGSFARKEDALARKRWVDGELSAMRVPDLSLLGTSQVRAPTVRQACETWRASRVDVTEATRVLHRLALARALSVLGNDRRVDELEPADVIRVVTEPSAAGKKRETIRKSVKYLAAVLDDHGVNPNPARDRRVRLPHEEHEEIDPPTADYVETVCRTLPRSYRLPLLWLDWSGARVGSIDSLTIDDYDERDRRVRLRASTVKTRAALWVDVPDVLGGDRSEPATARGQNRWRAALSRLLGRSASHRDREGVPSERHPGVLAARPAAPQDLAAAPAGPFMGGNRPVCRAAEALDHR